MLDGLDNFIFVFQIFIIMAKKDSQEKKIPVYEEGIDDLEQFIEKKKIQNEALKKIIEKLNSESNSNNKK